MGFLSSIGKMFGSAPNEQRSKPTPSNGHAPSLAATGVGVMDQASTLRDRVHRDTAAEPKQRRRRPQTGATTSDEPVVIEPERPHDAPDARDTTETAITAPRNKQELFEELQRNYRDVVELVRKVDAHLDRNEQRSQEMASIARRIDETLPALQQFPEQVKQQLDALNTEVVSAIRESTEKGEARSEAVQKSLATIGSRIESTSESHAQLVTTMAGFRETLGDLATSSSRTSDVLQSIDTRRQEREDELTKMLVASRRWSVTTLAVAIIGVAAAMSVAIVALVIGA